MNYILNHKHLLQDGGIQHLGGKGGGRGGRGEKKGRQERERETRERGGRMYCRQYGSASC